MRAFRATSVPGKVLSERRWIGFKRDETCRVFSSKVPPLRDRGIKSFPVALLAAVFLMGAVAQATPFSASMPKPGSEKLSTGDAARPAVASALRNLSDVRRFPDNCSATSWKLSDRKGCGDLSARAETVQVPEPTSLSLFGVGFLFIASVVRRRARLNKTAPPTPT